MEQAIFFTERQSCHKPLGRCIFSPTGEVAVGAGEVAVVVVVAVVLVNWCMRKTEADTGSRPRERSA